GGRPGPQGPHPGGVLPVSSGDSGPEDGTAGSAAGHPVFPAAPARLVLASASPRRRELLASLGWEFSLRPADIDESPRPGEAPAAYVERIARAKAAAVEAEPGDLVLAADTTVALAGELFGKPEDPAGARRMLARLAGRVHDVWTAVALRRVAAAGPTASGTDGIDTALERTAVELAPLDAA